MVKLIKIVRGKYISFSIAIPKLIAKQKGWKGGEEFRAEFDQDGNLVLIEVVSDG